VRKSGKFFFILVIAFFLCACGIEDLPFIDPVPQANVTPMMNNRATVRIPNDYDGSPFSHFAIFYRIYVSDIPQASTTSVNSYPAINSALATNFNFYNQYIDSTTLVNVNMDTLFRNRGYHLLHMQGGNPIGSVLTSSVWGRELVFDFSSGRAPTMTIGATPYTLWRSNGGGLFSPLPANRLFMNRDELYRPENIHATINADVQNKTGMAAGRRYTYAAMYIVAVGVNVATHLSIYSTPALIHVFQLPD
jgi:hypothetical protein